MNEAKTRKELIDKQLDEAGWDISDQTQVGIEYDINVGLPDGVSEAQTPYSGHQYSDYVLYGKDGKIIAVVEAKKTSVNAELGREQARQKFFYKNEKQIAVEKLWDAFERIKTYLSKDKKRGSTELVNTLNDKIISCDFEKELKILSDIGNNNMIRHTETDKNKINDPNYLDYLFFRMLSLLNLCLKEIDRIENNNNIEIRKSLEV